MKTLAEKIIEVNKTWNEAITAASEMAVYEDQNWGDGTSTFEFQDGSGTIFSGDSYHLINYATENSTGGNRVPNS